MAPGARASLPRCSGVRPSGALLVWALWLACSPCLAASWDHVLRVPKEGRERCRFKEEQRLGRDLDFFHPFSILLLPCTAPWQVAPVVLGCSGCSQPASPAERVCGAVGQLVPISPGDPWSPRCSAEGPPSLPRISPLQGRVGGFSSSVCVPGAPGEFGKVREGEAAGWGWEGCVLPARVIIAFGGVGGGNDAVQAAGYPPPRKGRLCSPHACAGDERVMKLCFPFCLRQLLGQCRAGEHRRNLKQFLCNELPSLTAAEFPAAASP